MGRYIIEIHLDDEAFERTVPFPTSENLDKFVEVMKDALAGHDGVIEVKGHKGYLIEAAVRDDVINRFKELDQLTDEQVDNIVEGMMSDEPFWDTYDNVLHHYLGEQG